MGYTIKINEQEPHPSVKLAVKAVRNYIKNDGRFSIGDIRYLGPMNKGARDGSRKFGCGYKLVRIRLVNAKEYCGQHPGPCFVNPILGQQPKKKMRLLEWDDWVEFNNLINNALDSIGCDADVWSEPMEIKGRMWVRKGIQRRIKYDYENIWTDNHWAPIQNWNKGTLDQFETHLNIRK